MNYGSAGEETWQQADVACNNCQAPSTGLLMLGNHVATLF
jgi:hypothetical protein